MLLMLCSMPLVYADVHPDGTADNSAQVAEQKKADAKLDKQKDLINKIEAAKLKIDALKYRTLKAQSVYNQLVKQLQATTKKEEK